MIDWQPIAAAPKIDGEHVLLYADETIMVGYWFEAGQLWSAFPGDEAIEPTHFTALPYSPEEGYE